MLTFVLGINYLADTRRNNDASITSQRRRNAIYVVCSMGSIGWILHTIDTNEPIMRPYVHAVTLSCMTSLSSFQDYGWLNYSCLFCAMLICLINIHIHMNVELKIRNHSVHAPSQWEMVLHCNAVSHCLTAYTEWSLKIINFVWRHVNMSQWNLNTMAVLQMTFSNAFSWKKLVLWVNFHLVPNMWQATGHMTQ